ncbi:hypothetical protein BKA70DRAFT_1405087 [Coprinopsis sp. MPI-PUGE-AT-0042]|nr:hypothetical protein BKA70DRAFT_1405087 [Coprinopsis sp. MPI-PUGE-AT-0042]
MFRGILLKSFPLQISFPVVQRPSDFNLQTPKIRLCEEYPPSHPGGWVTPREIRPVYDDHPIAPVWDALLQTTAKYLDASSIPFSAIAGFAMANRGEPAFCPLVMSIGVVPRKINFEQAKSVARHVKNVILCDAGFGHVDVAIREWRTMRLCGGGGIMKLESLEPPFDSIAEYRQPFSSTPSMSIAPLATPDVEGTASMYFRRAEDSDEVLLITTAHLVCPSLSGPASNERMTPRVDTNNSQPHEDLELQKVINLGVKSYRDASSELSDGFEAIGKRIKEMNSAIESLEKRVEQGKADAHTTAESARCISGRVKIDQRKLVELQELSSQLAENHYSEAQNRIIGSVVHVDPIARSPSGSSLDWAAIKLDNHRFNWANFRGNEVFIDCRFYLANLRQINGTVPECELRSPKTLNKHNERAMPVIKNGVASGTTSGWLNGLKTFARYPNQNASFDALELTIIPHGAATGSFAEQGDSGSAVLDSEGRAVGMITGGTDGVGVRHGMDLTYATPLHELEARIQEVFPGSFLYPKVDSYY